MHTYVVRLKKISKGRILPLGQWFQPRRHISELLRKIDARALHPRPIKPVSLGCIIIETFYSFPRSHVGALLMWVRVENCCSTRGISISCPE